METEESGRSMVEVLSVLVIVSLLSVSAVVGYRMAMDKYKATEILETAGKLAIKAKALRGGKGLLANQSLNLQQARLSLPPGVSDMAIDANGRVTVAGWSISVQNAVCLAAGDNFQFNCENS